MKEIRTWKFSMSLEKLQGNQKDRLDNLISDSSRGVSGGLRGV